MIRKLHVLIDEMEVRSSIISSMTLKNKLRDIILTGSLFNFANTPKDLNSMCRSVDSLVGHSGLTLNDAEHTVINLLKDRHFYGSFCELAAYDWLDRHSASHKAQVLLQANDVLNPNGCTIDGKFEFYEAYFDIKGFGMQLYLMDIFKQKLQPYAEGLTITIDGPLDVAVKDIDKYALGAIAKLKNKLTLGSVNLIKELSWSIKVVNPHCTTISEHSNNPYVFAELNRYYPFKTSRQFTRNAPFVLVFPYSSYFNNILTRNVFDTTDIALRALARRCFIQLTSDNAPLYPHDDSTDKGLTVADAAKLVSGLLFINLDDDGAWMFLNPRAQHKLNEYEIKQIFDFTPPVNMGIDDFKYDNY